MNDCFKGYWVLARPTLMLKLCCCLSCKLDQPQGAHFPIQYPIQTSIDTVSIRAQKCNCLPIWTRKDTFNAKHKLPKYSTQYSAAKCEYCTNVQSETVRYSVPSGSHGKAAGASLLKSLRKFPEIIRKAQENKERKTVLLYNAHVF